MLPLRLAGQYEVAAGQVSQPNYTHYLNELLFTHAGDSRGPASLQHDAARQNIRDTLASFGLQVTEETFYYQGGPGPYFDYPAGTYCNVTAVLPGKVRPGEYHVIGAHYDSVNNPGADDDGSGIAALLEAARVASLHDFEASLVFVAFDLEETGLIGSKAWVAAHSGDRIQSMLQLDMIAFNSPGRLYNQIALRPPDTSANPAFAAAWRAVAQYGTPLVPVTAGTSLLSDHASFAGVAPAVEMIEAFQAIYDMNPYNHKLSDSVDTPGNIDYDFAAAATRAVVGYLAQQARMLPDDPAAARLSPGGVYNLASFIVGPVAPGELITLAGSGFGDQPSVLVRDSAGLDRPVAVSYASGTQINLVLPSDLPAGAQTLVVMRDDGTLLETGVTVETVAPGVFTAASSGLGAPEGYTDRISPDGAGTTQNLFVCAAPAAGCVPTPVDFGGAGDRVLVVLYGTGIRGRSDLAGVSLQVAGQNLPVQYAGAQPTYPGLDQVIVELPRTLHGAGPVSATLRVDGRAANPVVIDMGAP